MWLPESFEYLILQSGIVKIPDLENILENASEYIDSRKYISWERFFTSLLVEYTKDTERAYQKAELNDYYKSENSRRRIEKGIPEGILNVLEKGREKT